MFRAAINNGVIVTVIALAITVLGLVSIFRVPIQMIPDMDLTTLTVETAWPGATPQDVEREIIIEQEEYLRTLPYLQKMTSIANTGKAIVELEFALGTEINEVLIRTNNALSQVEDYPPNVDEPRILTSAFSDNWFCFYIIRPLEGNPQGIDIETQLDYIEDHVKTALERVPGVSEIAINGGMNRQVRIYIDPAKLAERQITLSELRQALLRRNRDVSGGDLDAGKRRYLVRTMGQFVSIEDVENSIIAQRDGELIYLHDLGYAELTVAEQREESRVNGDPGLMILIKRQRGANIIEVADAVAEAVAWIDPQLMTPKGMRMTFMHADTIYIRQSVGVIASNLMLGAILALGVLYLFLRSPSSTMIGAIGIPVCTLAAFLGLLIAGRTINVISLAGVAFAIGMTLDNSIVVLENIHRHRQLGKDRFDAALAGVREVWTAVLASTLTTVFVFVPVMAMQVEVGQLYSDIAIAISASIIFSMLVAITLVPSAAANLAGATTDNVVNSDSLLMRLGVGFQTRVMIFVEWLMPSMWRQLALIGVVLLVAFGLVRGLTPKAEYLPEGEEPVTFTFMFPPSGYNLQQMVGVQQHMLNILTPEVGADPALFHTGERAVPSIRWMISTARPTDIFMGARTTDPADIDTLIEILTRENADIPGMISFSARGSIFSGNEGGTRSMDLEISGSELEPLFGVGLQAFLRAKQVLDDPQIKPSPPSLSLGQPMVEVRPDWARAAELGVNADDLGYLVWALADGAYHDDYYLADDKIDMYIYSTTGTVNHPDDLAELPIFTGRGDVVPLGSLAEIHQSVNTETIRRVNGERTITLSVVAPRALPLEAAVERVQTEVVDALHAEGKVPAGISIKIAGASDKLNATRAALGDNMILAVLLSYLLMVAIFRHWGYPLIIMLTVPLGIAGGIFGLWLMNLLPSVRQPFDMITMLGFLVLIGVVVNNPILLVERALQNRRAGMDIAHAVIESTRTRVRPIMMTTLTTLGGLAPLVFLPREGTELYRGLGIIVLFGLLSSTLLTLTFMPSLLSLLMHAGKKLKINRKSGLSP